MNCSSERVVRSLISIKFNEFLFHFHKYTRKVQHPILSSRWFLKNTRKMSQPVVSKKSTNRDYYKFHLKCLNCERSEYFMYTGRPNSYRFPECPNCSYGLYEATIVCSKSNTNIKLIDSKQNILSPMVSLVLIFRIL